MDSNPLFSGISPEQRSQMLCCFHPEYRNFQKGETILTYAAEPTTLGILLSGAAHLYYLDADGGYTLLEQFSANDLFGEIFLPPIGTLVYLVEADTPCQVLFLPYADLIRRCENACAHHSQLVSNLLQMTAKKAPGSGTAPQLCQQKDRPAAPAGLFGVYARPRRSVYLLWSAAR